MTEYLIVLAMALASGFGCGILYERRRNAKSEYTKMKREFDEHAKQVRERLDKARSRHL